jgi:hypothetical protein
MKTELLLLVLRLASQIAFFFASLALAYYIAATKL